jgi:hypothetical protein
MDNGEPQSLSFAKIEVSLSMIFAKLISESVRLPQQNTLSYCGDPNRGCTPQGGARFHNINNRRSSL